MWRQALFEMEMKHEKQIYFSAKNGLQYNLYVLEDLYFTPFIFCSSFCNFWSFNYFMYILWLIDG